MDKKALLASILYRGRLLGLVRSLQRPQVVVINYHRIRGADQDILFDEGVYGPTQTDFEQQVRWLKQHFDILSESELLDNLRSRRIKGRFAAITFDDGYHDNYSLAYPVLRSLGAPAIFFVCPAIVDSRRLGWWDIISYLVKKSRKPTISLDRETIPVAAAIGRLHDVMKRRKASETANLLQELSIACGVPLPDLEWQDRQLMTWEELREVSRHNVAIGSHTHTHRVLATLDEDAQRWELQQSKAALERELQQPIRTIAYPVGSYLHFTPSTMRIAEECGYEGAFSFHTGANYAGPGSIYNIRRIASTDFLDATFACAVYLPRLFSWYHPMPAEYAGHALTARRGAAISA